MTDNAVMISDLSDTELDAVAAGNGGYSYSSSFLKIVQVSNTSSTTVQGGNISVLTYKNSQSNTQTSSNNTNQNISI